MKKNILRVFSFVVLTTAMTACNNQAPKMDEKTQSSDSTATEMKIAFVEVDSIMSQYQFCKEYTKILEKKSQNIQNTINQKGQSLQAAAVKFQQDIQNNKYTQQQAEAVNAGLQKQQADLQALQQRLGNEFQVETDKFNEALRDSIQHFLASYNAKKKYSIILSKAGDNILYADKVYDITADVINGLNKAYKSKAAATEKKAEKK